MDDNDGRTEAGDAVSCALQFFKLPHLLPFMTQGALKASPSLFCYFDTMGAGGVVYLNTKIPLWVNVDSEILL